jgi:2-oxoglutarate ferredoxin oxidoreductase subunit gamma
MDRSEYRIAGAGGQGVVTAGRILAEAAILSGAEAIHNQVYGPQSRGGASRSDVVIATERIGYPLAEEIDLLVALSGEACSRYHPELADRSRRGVDSRCVPTDLRTSDRPYPIVDTARSVSGGQHVSGVVALGVLQALTGVVEAATLCRAVADRVPTRHCEMNLEALEAGMRLVAGDER